MCLCNFFEINKIRSTNVQLPVGIMMSSGLVLWAVIFLSQCHCHPVRHTPIFVCFDDQRSEHSFVADHSDINMVDDGNNAMSVRH